MWTDTTRAHHARAGLALPSDLTDAEWTLLVPFFPLSSHVGRAQHDAVIGCFEQDHAAVSDPHQALDPLMIGNYTLMVEHGAYAPPAKGLELVADRSYRGQQLSIADARRRRVAIG